MKQKYEIQKVLVLSTGHIPMKDMEALYEDADKVIGIPTLIVDPFRYGFYIYVNLDENEPKVEDEANWPYSEALKKLIKLARSLDCNYLKFDQDGEIYEDLEEFDWMKE